MPVKETDPFLHTRTDIHDPDVIRSAQLTKALGHPVRLAILALLSKRDTCFCGDFTDILPLAQSTVSQHLKALKDAGLITGTNNGVRTCYCLKSEGVQELRRHMNSIVRMLNRNNSTDCY